jgi:hypothetical protein
MDLREGGRDGEGGGRSEGKHNQFFRADAYLFELIKLDVLVLEDEIVSHFVKEVLVEHFQAEASLSVYCEPTTLLALVY